MNDPVHRRSLIDYPLALLRGLVRLILRVGWRFALGWGTALAMLTLFAELTEDVLEGEFTLFNHAVLELLHATSHPWLDRLALGLSTLGGITGTALVAGAALLLLLGLRRALDAATLLIVLAGGSLLTIVLKQIFRQPRPSVFESLAPETSFSFPSGHSLVSVCLYGYLSILMLRQNPRQTWLPALGILVIPLGIIWSRLYLGVHWVTDVTAGALVACFWLSISLMLRRMASRRRSS